MIKRTIVAIISALGALIQTYPATSQEVCRSIIEYASRDETDDRREQSSSFEIYSKHCEGTSYKSGSATNVGLDAVVKAVPFKFTFGSGSSEEKMGRFCKTYSESGEANAASSIRSSTVVREALSAFNQCIYLAGKGIYFVPSISKTSVTIDVSRGGEEAMIVGIMADKKLLECTVPSSSAGDGTKTADQDTRKALTGGIFPVNCKRLPEASADGTINYPDADLTILTTRGAFVLPISADGYTPRQWASDINKKISELDQYNNLNEQFRNKLSFSVVTSGNAQSSWSITPWGALPSQANCPAGQVMTGLTILHGGTCRGQCNPDGRPVAGFTLICSSALLTK